MKYLVRLLWKVLLPVSESFHPETANSEFFNLTGGRSFARSLGGDFRLKSVPVVLSPTDLFHAALRQTRTELRLEGSRFPYRSSNSQEPFSVNFSLHCHSRFLCVTIRLDPFLVEGECDWAKLQDIRIHGTLWPLTRKVVALSSAGDKAAPLNREPQVFPAIHIQALEEDLPDWKSQLVSLVTRHPNVNADVVDTVLEKNRAHQLDRTLLLVDKQGVAAYVPSGTTSDAVHASLARFENSAAMLQLGAALRLKLRANADLTDDERWAISSPNEVIPASVSGRRIWSLIVLEFSLQTWLNALKPVMHISSLPSNQVMPNAPAAPPRILLVTVTTVETRALQAALIEATGREPAVRNIGGFPYKDFGRIGDYEVWHQISGMGSGGLDGSQEAVRRGILSVSPFAVLMVGIAFGVDPKTQPIGTILVSKQIQTYELQRVNKDASITLRGDKVSASPMLLNWAAHAEVEWPESEPEVKKGLVLSGEKLVDNQDFRDQLVQKAPGALGGEMEGAGVYVASQTAKVEWLLVKAVCDWADGNKANDKDQLQAKAAIAAAKFSVLMLRATSESR